MMCLEDTLLAAAFHSIPMHDPGLKEVQRPARVCVCKGASVLPCLLSCCRSYDYYLFGVWITYCHSETYATGHLVLMGVAGTPY